jgi:uncharacterized repeat protein (TIGR03803 family)
MKSRDRAGIRRKTLLGVVAMPGILAAAVGIAAPALAQTYTETTIHNFSRGGDGDEPAGSLIQASDGNLYGTTYFGGPSSAGTVFKISNPTASPTESVIYSFTGGMDGGSPAASLIQAFDGNLYGTTAAGGSSGFGTVFRISNLTTSPTETVIYSFAGGADGDTPQASLIQATDGNLYGTTSVGGSVGDGTVFKISNPSSSPTESVIYNFAGGLDGRNPYAPLTQASDGNLYGTTEGGGSIGPGTVFKISNPTTSPTESVIYSFAGGTDGNLPAAGLFLASDGNMYGTTVFGGTSVIGSVGYGTVFKIGNPTTSPSESVIYSFSGGSDGGNPYASLIQVSDGNLYGTTNSGGSNGSDGTVFKIINPTTSPTESVIYSFTGSDGSFPQASLIQVSDGSLYGTTAYGGSASVGTVFKITGLPVAARLGYFTLTPCRLIDTRPGSTAPYGGPPLSGGSLRSFIAPGSCGVPSGAKAISANLTAVAPPARGDLRVFPSLVQGSPTSDLNFNPGRTRAGSGIFAIDAIGSFTIQCDMTAGTSTNVLLDVNGYFR